MTKTTRTVVATEPTKLDVSSYEINSDALKLWHTSAIAEYSALRSQLVQHILIGKQSTALALTLLGALISVYTYMDGRNLQLPVPFLFLSSFLFNSLVWVNLRELHIVNVIVRYQQDELCPMIRSILLTVGDADTKLPKDYPKIGRLMAFEEPLNPEVHNFKNPLWLLQFAATKSAKLELSL